MPYRALLLTIVLLVACNASVTARPTSSPVPAIMHTNPTITHGTTPLPLSAGTAIAPTDTAYTVIVPTATPTVTDRPTPTVPPDLLSFAETGHTLSGRFREFWEQNGGLAIFGLPLTEPLPFEGRTMQYFERARFELNPDDTVGLGLLGSEEAGPVGKVEAQAGCRYFAETGHNLCSPFLEYWQAHGDLAVFGLPLAEAEQRTGMRVQRFERARMEQGDSQTVLLGRLGDEALNHLGVGALLRPVNVQAAAQAVTVSGPTATLAPLSVALLQAHAEGYNGLAEMTIGDRRGSTWSQTVMFHDGQASLTQMVLGALGPHGLVITIDGKIADVHPGVFNSDAQTG
nr:hypothetical protein [Herpetosiphonaceae bacterium]